MSFFGESSTKKDSLTGSNTSAYLRRVDQHSQHLGNHHQGSGWQTHASQTGCQLLVREAEGKWSPDSPDHIRSREALGRTAALSSRSIRPHSDRAEPGGDSSDYNFRSFIRTLFC